VTPTRLIRTIALVALVLLALFVAGACRNPEDPDPLVGTYFATTFTMAASGQSAVNVLAAGGSLGLNVANNYVVTGTMIIPASVNGGATRIVSMNGTLDTAGTGIRLVQAASSFVRDLTFTLVENRLEAVNQTVDGTTYELILTKQ
jgi:hypothetical protein